VQINADVDLTVSRNREGGGTGRQLRTRETNGFEVVWERVDESDRGYESEGKCRSGDCRGEDESWERDWGQKRTGYNREEIGPARTFFEYI